MEARLLQALPAIACPSLTVVVTHARAHTRQPPPGRHREDPAIPNMDLPSSTKTAEVNVSDSSPPFLLFASFRIAPSPRPSPGDNRRLHSSVIVTG